MDMDEKIIMLTEHTPLISRLRVGPRRQRYPHQGLRGLCTVLLSGVLFVGVCLTVLLIFHPDIITPNDSIPEFGSHMPWSARRPSNAWPATNGLSYEELEVILQTTPDEAQVKEWSRYYTAGPHLAGKNLSQAEWTRDRWQEFGIQDTSIVAYDIYVNYPKGHRLALLETKSDDEGAIIKYEASLEEDILKEDGTSSLEDRIPTFHGYSASGNVTAEYVYANYGTFKDYDDLVKANVSLEGKIALVKYGGIFRGLKVKRAQELGMVGVVIYTDPGDDGAVTDEKGNTTYPNGPARQPSSVQRGSTQFLSYAPGDPTTPGYPSLPGVPRTDTDHAIPKIPSIPISYLDALPLLKALNGHGPKATDFNSYWQKGGLGYKGVEYNIGPAPNMTLNLVNEQEYVTTPMWNVIGIINGTLPDEVIVMGNHRDAWIAGGAADPNSGSAAFIELIRGFGKALDAGWKPLRTIVLASWDGEEYGLIGSTEWVEEYLPWLSQSAVAYINVDVGAAGPRFHTSAAPLLNKVLTEAAYKVQSPNQTVAGQTIGDVWSGKISTMGSGSDFTAFQDFAGVPCIDMGFSGGAEEAVYHYHSNYDSFDWMDRFGDPGWHYHVAIAKLWGVLAADLVESPVIRFNASDYAKALGVYLASVEKQIEASPLAEQGVSLHKLSKALAHLGKASIDLDATAEALREELDGARDVSWWRKVQLYYDVRRVNNKYKYLERQFLYPAGLDDRSWFKHTVFAPGRWTGYAGATFPGLVESLEDGDVGNFYKWEGVITEEVYKAVRLLE